MNSLEVAEEALIERIILDDCTQNLLEQYAEINKNTCDSIFHGMVQIYGSYSKNVKGKICDAFAEVEYGIWEEYRLTFLVLYYVDFYDTAKRILEYIMSTEGIKGSAVCIQKKQPMNRMRECYKICSSYKERLFYQSAGTIIRAETYDIFDKGQYASIEQKYMQQIEGRLIEVIPSGEWIEVNDIISQMFQVFESKRLSKETIEQELYPLLISLEKKFVIGNDIIDDFITQDRQLTVNAISKSTYVEEIEQYLMEYIGQILTYFKVQKKGKNSYIVLKVKDYVKRNYTSIMSVDDMAQEIHLSQNYIRSIFKENTGQTILEYITDYRLERACNLLRDKTLKIHEISQMVGYENVSYFCAIFVKRYLVSPNEYRKRL